MAIITLPNGITFEMLEVLGTDHLDGTDKYFLMGSAEDDEEALKHEKPQYKVTLSTFQLAKYPVTQELWRAVAEATPDFPLSAEPSSFKGDRRPVERVSWEDIDSHFLPALRALTGKDFQLPTEAQWEYAARGGIYYREDYIYSGSDMLDDVGWYRLKIVESKREM